MRSILFLFFSFFSWFLNGQDWRYDVFVPKYKSEILDTSNLNKARSSRVLRDLSFISAFEELYQRDVIEDNESVDAIMNLLDDSSVSLAKPFIVQQSQSTQLVIINESHYRPEHRLFTAELLESLYDKGYRYLALEAIFSNQKSDFTRYPENQYYLGDTTILKRGFPLMKACSGTYVKEPQFGNMIRRAISIGYSIIGYEENGQDRELNQAKNISKIFNRDPQAKVVVHCGYSHLIEDETYHHKKRGLLMAAQLKLLTGINPLTINQSQYSNIQNLSESIFKKVKLREPIVIFPTEQAFVSHLKEEQEYWDMAIFHPPIKFGKQKRPTWLSDKESLHLFSLKGEEIDIEYPVRIKLHSKGDRFDAVPIDVIEAIEPMDTYHLYGPVSDGFFVIENIDGNRQVIKAVPTRSLIFGH